MKRLTEEIEKYSEKYQFVLGYKNASNQMMYIANWEGDPPRTHLIGCAKFFESIQEAKNHVMDLESKYRDRNINYQIIQVHDT